MASKVLLSATVDWPSIARLAGGFAAASFAVDALTPRRSPILASRYLNKAYSYRPLSAISSLRHAIKSAQPDIIVPCDDRAVTHLLRLHAAQISSERKPAIADLIERSLGALENYDCLLSRSRSLNAMRQCGVRVPDTVPVSSEYELESVLAVTGLPAVFKSDGSWGGDGVIIARSLEEAKRAFRRLANPPSRLRSLWRTVNRRDTHHLLSAYSPPRPQICVQRFVQGNPAASAFACWKGEMLGGIYYDILVAEEAIGPPNVIRRLDCPQMAEASRLAAKQFGLSGLHGLDFIRDSSGDVHLIEINPRATQGGTLAFGAGRDLPSLLSARVAQKAVGIRDAIANDVVVLFPREWQRDPASPYLKTGHHDVPWDDPAVFLASLGVSAPPTLKPAKA